MAKRKRKKSSGGRRRTTARNTSITVRAAPARPARRRTRRRSGGGGGGYAMMPSKDTMVSWGMSGVYGYLEKAASTDAEALLNKVPKVVPQLGYTGNVAFAAWMLGGFMKQPLLRKFGNSVAHVAAYQIGHKGELFKEAGEQFSLSGPGGGHSDIDPDELDHLAAAMEAAAVDVE